MPSVLRAGPLACLTWRHAPFKQSCCASWRTSAHLTLARNVHGAVRTRTFEDILGSKLPKALATIGILSPNEIQASVLPLALEGRELLVVAQTGSGKTIISLLPIFHCLLRQSLGDTFSRSTKRATETSSPTPMQPQALVLSPTIELASQHSRVIAQLAQALPERHISSMPDIADQLDSQTQEGREEEDQSRILSTTPSRFLRAFRDGRVQTGLLRVVAFDEVDALLCGEAHSREMPLAATELLEALLSAGQPVQLLMTTAHLTEAHEHVLRGRFPRAELVRHQGSDSGRRGVLVPTLRQRFHYFNGDKEQQLLRTLARAEADPHLREGTCAVFCASEPDAEKLCALVASAAPQLLPTVLHARMPDAARLAALDRFRLGESRVLVCTACAARGLDLPLLRHVVLYDPTPEVADFVHSAGRTARRGTHGLVTCLVQAGDAAALGRFQALHALQPAPQLSFHRGEQ
uniref:RNA helicase n=2 Tax=Chrysotila carterae TaxID=13221 RepID=A0A7S4EUR1_CHRCT